MLMNIIIHSLSTVLTKETETVLSTVLTKETETVLTSLLQTLSKSGALFACFKLRL